MNTRQAMQLLAVVQTNVDWGSIEPSIAQSIIDDPVETGVRFTEFIRNGVRSRDEQKETIIPNLRSTGTTLADWLHAREELQKFFTGETVILRDLFALTDEDLTSTTLMPSFRPAGATNRMAVEWKQKLGVTVYEEMDVMNYTGSKGPKEPKLYLVTRSLRPDEDTLGENKKTPDQLIQVPDKLWLGLYGYCDADNLHFAITGEHLDPDTWTWFPNDRSGRSVAHGGWNPLDRRFCLRWDDADYSGSRRGARSAREVPLRT